jgi:hypothetical protein
MKNQKDLEQQILNAIKKQNLSVEELTILAKGLKHKTSAGNNVYDHSDRHDKHFKFALIGDTHIGNKSCDIKALTDFYNRSYKLGVRHFYHCGDLVDGLHVHRGQEYELTDIGMEQQAKAVIENYPFRKDAITYYILGNHDLWYKQNVGGSIESLITKDRQDIQFLGDNEADIILCSGSKLRLLHPGDGNAYALSYKPQKIIESIEGGNKPNILGIGHYHKSLQMFYRNIFAFLVGTFEHQTSFLRSKGISVHLGGWIIEGHSGSKGGINDITATFIPYMNFKG